MSEKASFDSDFPSLPPSSGELKSYEEPLTTGEPMLSAYEAFDQGSENQVQRTYQEVVSSAEIPRAPTNHPKHNRKSAQTPAKKKTKSTFNNIKRNLKKVTGKLTTTRPEDEEADPTPTIANLPSEIATSQDHFGQLFLATSEDRSNPEADPGSCFVDDYIGRPDESAAASRKLLDIIFLLLLQPYEGFSQGHYELDIMQAATYELMFFTMSLLYLFTPTTPTSVNRLQQVLYETYIARGKDAAALKELYTRILNMAIALTNYYRHLTTSCQFTCEELLLSTEYQAVQNRISSLLPETLEAQEAVRLLLPSMLNMPRDKQARQHLLHCILHLLHKTNNGPIAEHFKDAVAHLPELAKYWLQFYGLFHQRVLRVPSLINEGYYWASIDYRNSKYLHAISNKYRQLSRDILERELSAPVYVSPLPSMAAAKQELENFQPNENSSLDSLDTAASELAGPPSSAPTEDHQVSPDQTAPQVFLVMKNGNDQMVHELLTIQDLAKIGEIVAAASGTAERPLPQRLAATPQGSSTPNDPLAVRFEFSGLQTANLDTSFAVTELSNENVPPLAPTVRSPASDVASSFVPLRQRAAAEAPSEAMPPPVSKQSRPARAAKRTASTSLSQDRVTRSQVKKTREAAPTAGNRRPGNNSSDSEPDSDQGEDFGGDPGGDPQPPNDGNDDSSDDLPGYVPGPVTALPPFRPNNQTPRNTPSSQRPVNQRLGAFNINWNVPRGRTNPDGIANSGHRRFLNVGPMLSGDTTSMVNYTASGDNLPARDRPLHKGAEKVQYSIPGQLTLVNSQLTERQRQDLYRIMRTCTYRNTWRHGRIPCEQDLAAKFSEYYQTSLVPLPATCHDLVDADFADTEEAWVELFEVSLPQRLADGNTVLRFFSTAVFLPEGTINWLAGMTEELQPDLPADRLMFFRQTLDEEATLRVLTSVSKFLFKENHATAGVAEFVNLLYVRSYRKIRCRSHQLDIRPVQGHGSNVCLSTQCRLASPGCLLACSSIMGLFLPALMTCSLLSRGGVAAGRRGTVRTIPEILATPGYTKECLVVLLPFCLSILDRTSLLKATSAAVSEVMTDQLQTLVHPVIPGVGTTLRILYPESHKSPDAPGYSQLCKDQALVITLSHEFKMGMPICAHATSDLAYEMTTVDAEMGHLYYFYIKTIFSEDPFTADSTHRRSLPNNIPQVPLPESLSPDGSADYFLLRSVTPVQRRALYVRLFEFLEESELYQSWLQGGAEREKSERIRALVAEYNCTAVYNHGSTVNEAAAGLAKLRDLMHSVDHPLSEHVDNLLPSAYFPRVETGCGRPLCGKIAECAANQREWKRLLVAVKAYQQQERDYPAYHKICRRHPTGHWPKLEMNRLTLALYRNQPNPRFPNGLDKDGVPILQYLIQEGFDKDGLSLLLQHNSSRILGLYLRAGSVDGREPTTEPSIATPAAYFIGELSAVISLGLQIPSRVSRRFLLLHTQDVYRNHRPWAGVIPGEGEDSEDDA